MRQVWREGDVAFMRWCVTCVITAQGGGVRVAGVGWDGWLGIWM
jgi:hypothetical protein